MWCLNWSYTIRICLKLFFTWNFPYITCRHWRSVAGYEWCTDRTTAARNLRWHCLPRAAPSGPFLYWICLHENSRSRPNTRWTLLFSQWITGMLCLCCLAGRVHKASEIRIDWSNDWTPHIPQKLFWSKYVEDLVPLNPDVSMGTTRVIAIMLQRQEVPFDSSVYYGYDTVIRD